MILQVTDLCAQVFGNVYTQSPIQPILPENFILQVQKDFVIKIQEKDIGQGQGYLQTVSCPVLGIGTVAEIYKTLFESVPMFELELPDLILKNKLLKNTVFFRIGLIGKLFKSAVGGNMAVTQCGDGIGINMIV